MGLGSSLAGTCGKTLESRVRLLFSILSFVFVFVFVFYAPAPSSSLSPSPNSLRPIESNCPSSLSTLNSSHSSRASMWSQLSPYYCKNTLLGKNSKSGRAGSSSLETTTRRAIDRILLLFLHLGLGWFFLIVPSGDTCQ
jgi:hypothetical protein